MIPYVAPLTRAAPVVRTGDAGMLGCGLSTDGGRTAEGLRGISRERPGQAAVTHTLSTSAVSIAVLTPATYHHMPGGGAPLRCPRSGVQAEGGSAFHDYGGQKKKEHG